jgi:hypothetical protein
MERQLLVAETIQMPKGSSGKAGYAKTHDQLQISKPAGTLSPSRYCRNPILAVQFSKFTGDGDVT